MGDQELVVARCDRKAAKYAVERWHYSRTMPTARLICYGVWEHGRFIGSVIYGRGANNRMLLRYGITQVEGCELVRVALREHVAPVTQIVAETLRQLKKSNPGMRLVVSFADPEKGHHGGIYQAGGWMYLGRSVSTMEFVVKGERTHARSVNAASKAARGTVNAKRDGESRVSWLRRMHGRAETIYAPPKHRYVMPLDKGMRRQLTKLAMPYPAKCGRSLDGETPGPRSGSASSTLADRSTD